LDWDFSAANTAGTFASRVSDGVKKVKRQWFAKPFSIGESGIEFHIDILIGKGIGIGKVHKDIVEGGGIGHRKIKIQGIAVGPLSAGNGFVLFKKVTGAASGNAKDQEEEGIFHKLMEVKVDQL
jgi:hypothetical protein